MTESKKDNKDNKEAQMKVDKKKLLQLKHALESFQIGENEASEMRKGTLFQLPKHLQNSEKASTAQSHHTKSNSTMKKKSKDRDSKMRGASKLSQNTSSDG